MAMRTIPDATAAPDPEDEPPLKCSGFHGLRAGANGRSKLGPPNENSCVESLLRSTVPAALGFVLKGQMYCGKWAGSSEGWQVGWEAEDAAMSVDGYGVLH